MSPVRVDCKTLKLPGDSFPASILPTDDVVASLLKAREVIDKQIDDLDRKVLKPARHEAQIRRYVTVPGVGPLTALCFRATIDDPARFKRFEKCRRLLQWPTSRDVLA